MVLLIIEKLGDSMTDIEKIKFYDKCVENAGSSFVTYDRAFCDFIEYYDTHNYPDNEMKIKFIDSFLPIFNKAKENNEAISFVDLYGNFFHVEPDYNVNLCDLIQLTYNPEDCFNFEGMSEEEINKKYRSYYIIICDLFSMIKYWFGSLDIYSRTISYICRALKIVREHKYEDDFLTLDIILYCLRKQYDYDKLESMIRFLNEHNEELYAYLMMNDSREHCYKLCNSVLENIDEGSCVKQEIR